MGPDQQGTGKQHWGEFLTDMIWNSNYRNAIIGAFVLFRKTQLNWKCIKSHTVLHNWMAWTLAMFRKYYLSRRSNLLVSWALMIECLVVLPKAASIGLCLHLCMCICVCVPERAVLKAHIESLPSLLQPPRRLRNLCRRCTVTALSRALRDSLFSGWK